MGCNLPNDWDLVESRIRKLSIRRRTFSFFLGQTSRSDLTVVFVMEKPTKPEIARIFGGRLDFGRAAASSG